MVPDSQHKRLYKVWKGNNNFFCGGRCIFGPDVTSLSLSILLIAGPAITFCYQIHAKIQHRKYHEEESVYDNQLLGFPVLVATIIALLATTYENFRYHFDKTNNPFNIGVLRNIKEVFFSRIAPSMINFRAWNLDEAVVNDMYASCVGMDVICKDEKFNTEKDGRMPFPTILHNFGYNFISENKIAVNKLEGNFPDPSALPNIQKQNLQGLGENKQNCRGEDGSIAGNMVGLIEDGTAIDGVANEGNSSSEIIVPANQHANVQEI